MGLLRAGEIRMWWAGRLCVGWWRGNSWFVRLFWLVAEGRHDSASKLFQERGGLYRFRRIPGTAWRVHVRRDC